MIDSKIAEDLRNQLTAVRRLLASPDWLIWSDFLKKERRKYLQDKVNAFIREGNLVQAQIALALKDDCLKQIELFGKYISDTESKIKQGEKENGNKT